MVYFDHRKLTAHNTVPNTEIGKVGGCENLTCFEIMHLQSNEDLWYKCGDNGLEDNGCGHITYSIDWSNIF